MQRRAAKPRAALQAMQHARNPIWVMDPGLFGPPPGVPRSPTVAARKHRLRAADVDYLAYAYDNDLGEPVRLDAAFLRINGPGCFQERIATATAAGQAVLLKLRASVPVVYDDGTR